MKQIRNTFCTFFLKGMLYLQTQFVLWYRDWIGQMKKDIFFE